MRVKKAKKPRRSIKYLLSADSKFKRLSLKKLSDGVKKATQSLRPSRSKRAPAVRRSPRSSPAVSSSPAISSRAMVLSAVCVLAAAALITARQPSPAPRVATNVGAPQQADIQPEAAPSAARPAPKPVVSKPATKAAPVRTSVTDVSMLRASTAASPAAPAVETTPRPEAAPAAAVKGSTEPMTSPPAGTDPPATITGCLEFNNETFRLKNTSGEDAPKSRSWKSGFLRKRSASIELADTGSLRLSRYVGQRVSVTGTLSNREMQPFAVRPIAGSCN